MFVAAGNNGDGDNMGSVGDPATAKNVIAGEFYLKFHIALMSFFYIINIICND